jgi:hypothetical protein
MSVDIELIVVFLQHTLYHNAYERSGGFPRNWFPLV